MKTYLFTSDRLGFRNWEHEDISKMAVITANSKVMEFFPATWTTQETADFILRMQTLFEIKGFCYFAVETLENNEFIGFIGFSEQLFESAFTPCVDIGWRLAEAAWNKGYATEGAKRCLKYAFENLNLATVKAIAPAINVKSINIMQKIGMTEVGYFNHPKLIGDERLGRCVCFEIQKCVN